MKRINFHFFHFPFLFLFLLLSQSCFKSDDCDPSVYCDTVYPDSAWINVQVTYKDGDPDISLVLYKGYAEDEDVVLRDTLFYPSAYYYLPTGQFYSVKVSYYRNNQVINAYDGEKLRVNKFWNCDERCYEAPDLNLNLELLE